MIYDKIYTLSSFICFCIFSLFFLLIIDQARGVFVRRDSFSMVCIVLQDITCITLKKENVVNL